MNKKLINKEDAPLYVDIFCVDCGRRIALSHAHQHENKYLCRWCYIDIQSAIDALFKEFLSDGIKQGEKDVDNQSALSLF